MMTKMREELNKELEVIKTLKENDNTKTSGSDSSNHQELQMKSQIKHISDQIKCVGFLLMQAQVGLETLNDEMFRAENTKIQQPPIYESRDELAETDSERIITPDLIVSYHDENNSDSAINSNKQFSTSLPN